MTKSKIVAFILATISAFCVFSMHVSTDIIFAVDTVNDSLVNFSFEEGEQKKFFTSTYYEPDGWTATYPTALNSDSSVKHDGEKSIKVSENTSLSISSNSGVRAKSNTLYQVGYMVYTTNTEGLSLGITVNSYDGASELVETFSVSGVAISQTESWQKVSFDIGTGQTVKSIVVSIDVINSGKNGFNLDAVYIQENNVVVTNPNAAVRISEDTPGLRFTGRVDKTTYDTLCEKYSSVNAGMLIVPENYLQEIGEFTFADIISVGFNYLDIQAKIWNNDDTVDEDGFYGFNCAITKIKTINISKKFCARSYIRYIVDGVEKYIYGNFDLANNSRSIQEVATLELQLNGQDYCPEDRAILEYFSNNGKDK